MANLFPFLTKHEQVQPLFTEKIVDMLLFYNLQEN